MGVKRHFLGWDRPVLHVVAEFLLQGLEEGLVDLSSMLVIVPTRQSGRRLREHLAAIAGKRGHGLLPPLQATPPDFLLRVASKPKRMASQADRLAVIARLLLDADLSRFPSLFPIEVSGSARNLQWALGIADTFCELYRLLGEAGLKCADVTQVLAHALDGPVAWDPGRWTDLAELERRYSERLLGLGLFDPEAVKHEAAAHPVVPPGVRRIVMAGVPDPIPLTLRALRILAERTAVDICVHAPADHSDRFDAWGRPVADPWCRHLLDIPDDCIQLVARPRDQARATAELVATRLPPIDVAVGVPDAEISPYLEREFASRDIAVFDPAGRLFSRHTIYHLLNDFRGLLATDNYEYFSSLVRNPDLLEYLASEWPGEFDVSSLLIQLDRFQNAHLPSSFGVVRSRVAESGFPELAHAVARTASLVESIRGSDFASSVSDLLGAIYAPRELLPANDNDRDFAEASAVVMEQLGDSEAEAVEGSMTGAPERMSLFLHTLSRALYSTEPGDRGRDVELGGWLELHWNDAPHLLLTGFNEGRVPESVVGHPFLPDLARRRLGLMHNEQRFARDVYLLSAMLASRRGKSHTVRIIAGKTTGQGDACKPSRLLFLCDDERLPGRVQRLFGDVEEYEATVPWQREWTLKPATRAVPSHLSVTSFADYLTCPFRFYLKRVLRMEQLHDRKPELSPADFGNICHRAFEAFGNDPAVRDSTCADEIAEFLEAAAERFILAEYGPALSTAVAIQAESMRQRLRAAARQQSELRRDGWSIQGVEYVLGQQGKGIDWNGMRITGKIDRVDRNSDGRIRLLDYKTSDKAAIPEHRHLKPWREGTPEFAKVLVNGRTRRWVDLQIPLYCLLLRGELGRQPECGYFSMPKAVSQTGITTWDMDADLLAAAEQCAAAVIEQVSHGVFWPPADRAEFDEFGEIFSGSAAASAEPPESAREASP